MKTPYLLHFDVPFTMVSAPPHAGFTQRLAAASDVHYYTFDATALAVQHLNLHPFYVELFELSTSTPFSFGLELTGPQHFLFFMRQGQARFTTPEGFYLSYAPEAHLSACYKPAGHYRVQLRPGQHVACCVTLDPHWLSYATEKLPVFRFPAEAGPVFLPYVPLGPFLRQRLEEVLALRRNGHGRLDGFLRLKFAEILEHYSPRAEEKKRDIAYKVKDYLDHHFIGSHTGYASLSTRFGEGERQLRYRFEKEFGTSIHRFLTHKRLQLAHRLITQEGQPIRDVYLPSGYQDESTFRYAYRKFFSDIGKSDI